MFLLLRHLYGAVVDSTLTLLEITLLVVVLAQSAHVDTKVIFQALLVENKDVMREVRCGGSNESHKDHPNKFFVG